MGPLAFLGTLFGGPIGAGLGSAAEQGGLFAPETTSTSTSGGTRLRFGGTSGFNYSEGTDLKPLAYAAVAIAAVYLITRK